MDSVFDFRIGDVVKHKLDAEGFGPYLMIVERLFQECPGGHQIHYKARTWGAHSPRHLPPGGEVRLFNEIELRPLTELEKESQYVVMPNKFLKELQDTVNYLHKRDDGSFKSRYGKVLEEIRKLGKEGEEKADA